VKASLPAPPPTFRPPSLNYAAFYRHAFYSPSRMQREAGLDDRQSFRICTIERSERHSFRPTSRTHRQGGDSVSPLPPTPRDTSSFLCPAHFAQALPGSDCSPGRRVTAPHREEYNRRCQSNHHTLPNPTVEGAC
jgi:hypothetical protein